MNFTRETEFDGKIDEFLYVSSNKQQLIASIGEQLKKVGYTVIFGGESTSSLSVMRCKIFTK